MEFDREGIKKAEERERSRKQRQKQKEKDFRENMEYMVYIERKDATISS